MKRRGFKLIELIVVMAIMVIITASSIPSFLKFTKTARLRAAARDVTTAFRTARRYAITQRVDYAVTVYCTGGSIEKAVSFYETADRPELKRFPPNISANTGYHGAGGIDESKEFIFAPIGRCKTAGTIYVVDSEQNYIPITVLGATGRVRIYDINYP